jgi:hypothetical protein
MLPLSETGMTPAKGRSMVWKAVHGGDDVIAGLSTLLLQKTFYFPAFPHDEKNCAAARSSHRAGKPRSSKTLDGEDRSQTRENEGKAGGKKKGDTRARRAAFSLAVAIAMSTPAGDSTT